MLQPLQPGYKNKKEPVYKPETHISQKITLLFRRKRKKVSSKLKP